MGGRYTGSEAFCGLKLSKALFTSKEVPSQEGLKIVRLYKKKMFQVGLPELRPVKKTRKNFSRDIHSAHVSPMFPNFPNGKHCFQCQFLFSRCKLCLRYTAGNFNKNPSMRAFAKILRARASEHSSITFCEQFEQRPNFASTSNCMGPFDTPNT